MRGVYHSIGLEELTVNIKLYLMENILLILALIISLSASSALWIGLKFQINDYNCKDEVKSVNSNISLVKWGYTILTLLLISLLVLLNT